MRLLTTHRDLVLHFLLGGLLIGTVGITTVPVSSESGWNDGNTTSVWTPLADDHDATAISLEGARSRADLARVTDIPLKRPPDGVQHHNRERHQSVASFSPRTSVHPPNADLHDGTFLNDAYASIYSVQPSTRLLVSPSTQRHYVAPNGELLGTIDYRVDLPSNSPTGEQRVHWHLEDHTISTVELFVDTTLEDETNGSHTPVLRYSDLAEYPGNAHTLTLRATVQVRVRKVVEECTTRGPSSNDSVQNATAKTTRGGDQTGGCTDWNRTVELYDETRTVRDSIPGRTYNPSVRGYRAKRPTGETEVVVRADQPIAGVTTGDHSIRGVWRYFRSRDDTWTTLHRSHPNGTTTTHESAAPIRTSAYPSAIGSVATVPRTTTIEAEFGPKKAAPALPPNVNLDVAPGPYTATRGFTFRTDAQHGPDDSIAVIGLIGSPRQSVGQDLTTRRIHGSSLTLSIGAVSDTAVNLTVRLTAAADDTPINTRQRPGYVVLEGRRVNTTGNGTVHASVPRGADTVTARYEPGPIETGGPVYAESSATVYVRETPFPSNLPETIGLHIGLVVCSVVLIDRVTGWSVWPPWRRF